MAGSRLLLTEHTAEVLADAGHGAGDIAKPVAAKSRRLSPGGVLVGSVEGGMNGY